MKARKWLAGAALLSMLASASGVLAAEGDKADKGDKGKKAGGDKKEMRVSKPDKRTLERIEKIAGKPLTEDQTKAVQAAWEKREAARKALENQFKADVAQALGITVEQLAEKEREIRAAEKKEGGKPAAP